MDDWGWPEGPGATNWQAVTPGRVVQQSGHGLPLPLPCRDSSTLSSRSKTPDISAVKLPRWCDMALCYWDIALNCLEKLLCRVPNWLEKLLCIVVNWLAMLDISISRVNGGCALGLLWWVCIIMTGIGIIIIIWHTKLYYIIYNVSKNQTRDCLQIRRNIVTLVRLLLSWINIGL